MSIQKMVAQEIQTRPAWRPRKARSAGSKKARLAERWSGKDRFGVETRMRAERLTVT